MSHIDPIGSAQAARMLGISRATLNRRTRTGDVPTISKLPGKLGPNLFDRAEIERLAAEQVTA